MRIVFLTYISLLSAVLFAQKSNLNGLEVSLDSTDSYTFFITGHIHGDGNNKSHMPVNTFMANLDWINESDYAMMINLGDLFLDVQTDIPYYETYLFDKLKMPLFNSVGNHDLSGEIYQENFGDTYHAFRLKNDLHIVLDTEQDDGDIEGEQLEFLKKQLKDADKNGDKNIFVYAHRTIWKDSYSDLEGLFTDNTQGITAPNFEDEVLPLLKESEASIYWFAGSLGPAPASFFHYKDDNGITYIATAIRGLKRDAILEVNSDNGKITFTPKTLTGEELLTLEEYDVEMWKEGVGEEPFRWGLLWYYFKLMLTHRYFWYGIGFALFSMLAFRFAWRKWKARG